MGTTSGINALSKGYCEQLLADKTEWNDVLRALPYYLNEGQNAAGLFAGLNVVPANDILEGDPTVPTTGTNPVGVRTSALMIPSLILQNCGSATEAKSYIEALNIYCPDGSEVHLMIGDSSGALWLLEFINNGIVWTDMTAADKAPYMTNYYQTYAVYGSDKKLVNHDHIGTYPNGVHRGDLVADNLSSISSVESALNFLQTTVKYTNTYTDSWNWIDEFCGNTSFGDLTITKADIDPSAFTDIITWAQDRYASRARDDGFTWQTVFSAVNDINAKKMYVVVQEQGISAQHMFELDDTPVEADHHILVDELPTTDIDSKNLYLVKNETETGKIDTVAKYDGINWWEVDIADDATVIDWDTAREFTDEELEELNKPDTILTIGGAYILRHANNLGANQIYALSPIASADEERTEQATVVIATSGSQKGMTKISEGEFYHIDTVGIEGQVWTSKGEGRGEWKDAPPCVGVGETFPEDPYLNQVFIISHDN